MENIQFVFIHGLLIPLSFYKMDILACQIMITVVLQLIVLSRKTVSKTGRLLRSSLHC